MLRLQKALISTLLFIQVTFSHGISELSCGKHPQQTAIEDLLPLILSTARKQNQSVFTFKGQKLKMRGRVIFFGPHES